MIRQKSFLLLLGFAFVLAFGACNQAPKDVSTKQRQPRHHEETSPQDDIQNDIRAGGLKDPGGARDVRQEMQDQKDQEQKDINEIDQQN